MKPIALTLLAVLALAWAADTAAAEEARWIRYPAIYSSSRKILRTETAASTVSAILTYPSMIPIRPTYSSSWVACAFADRSRATSPSAVVSGPRRLPDKVHNVGSGVESCRQLVLTRVSVEGSRPGGSRSRNAAW